jgi:nucleoside-diphosphate-sugar epimerase
MADNGKLRVLVTGGSGFLGSHVVEQLARAGHEVVALVRSTSKRDFLSSLPNVSFVTGAVEQKDTLRKAADGVDAIVHAAGLVKALTVLDFEAVNVEGTQNLLDLAKKRAAGLKRFVFVSSLAAIGPSEDGKPVSPDQEPHPLTHYGRSKLRAERAVMAMKDELPVTVIRPPMIYGPRDKESFAFFQAVNFRLLPMVGDGNNTMSVVYGADAASACIKAIFADTPSGKAYFVDDGNVYVWREMLDAVETALKRRALLRFSIPMPVLRLAAFASEEYARYTKKAAMLTRDKLNELLAAHWVCDSSSTRADLGWTPEVDWAEGTRRAATWYLEQGWL